MKGSKVSLGYWRIRGRGQVPRLLLAYTGAIWEDVQYTTPEQWLNGDKHALQLDFPNLPYLIEGNFRITETAAICTYIIDRSSRTELLGKNIQEKAFILNLVGVIEECLNKLVTVAYTGAGMEKTWKELQPKMEYLSKYKGKREWLFGYLTLADFLLVEMSYYLEKLYPQEFKNFFFLLASRISF